MRYGYVRLEDRLRSSVPFFMSSERKQLSVYVFQSNVKKDHVISLVGRTNNDRDEGLPPCCWPSIREPVHHCLHGGVPGAGAGHGEVGDKCRLMDGEAG